MFIYTLDNNGNDVRVTHLECGREWVESMPESTDLELVVCTPCQERGEPLLVCPDCYGADRQ